MRYSESKFTVEQIDKIKLVAEKVCYFFGITMEDLMSKSRKRELVEARMIVCYYQYHNINIESIKAAKTYGLSCWFFNKDHTTGHHYINTCADIMTYNEDFNYNYSVIKNLINKHNDVIDKPSPKELTWDDIKRDFTFPNKVKYSMMPIEIKNSIDNYLSRRYGYGFIADVLNVNYEFIQYYVNINGGVNSSTRQKKVLDSSRANVPNTYNLIRGR